MSIVCSEKEENVSAMIRSVSLPVQPKPIEDQPLKRSQEKEDVHVKDYYPESPNFGRRRKSQGIDHLETRSENNFPYTNDWSGSTIELSPDIKTDELDSIRKRSSRVIEKNGHENVTFRNLPEKPWRFIRDFVTTLVRPSLRFFPKRDIVQSSQCTASNHSSSTTMKRNNLETQFEKLEQTSTKTTVKGTEAIDSDIYSITTSIERKLCELAEEPQNLTKIKKHPIHEKIELEWKYMLTMFLGSYFFSWFFFGVLCYMVAYSHGDMLFDEVTGERLGEGKEPCIIGVYDFLSMIIYSIETQTTIGFGEKYPSEECPETIFLFIMQIICSIAIEGGMVSIIYAKTARPAKQLTKLKFSEKAVICYRDNKLCLLFRVCDLREQQTIETKIRVYMIVDKLTREGEIIKTHTELKLLGNGQQIIVWPEVVCHVIDEFSPLCHLTTAKKFNSAQFELYVSIVGTSSATAQVTEARTSYMPREIFWGQRFVNIISYDVLNEHYMIDYENFNTTISVDMPGGITKE